MQLLPFHKHLSVAGTANIEVVATILTGQEAAKVNIQALRFVENTATENNDARIRVYLDQIQIVDVSIQQFLVSFDSDSGLTERMIEIPLVLNVNSTLKVGQLSGSTASDIVFDLKYTQEV